MHDVFVRNKLRERQSSQEIENSWEISYGDMITLLLAFFVMFFNIKTETMNMKLVKKDIDKYFSEKKDPHKLEASQEDNREIGQKSKEISSEQKANVPIISSQVKNSLKIKSNIQGQNVHVDFPGVEFFKSGSVKLTPEGEVALKEFTSAISNHLGSFRLVVRGFTDATPIKSGRYKDNLELSAVRSISAIRYMNKQGIGTHYMRIAGYGETDGDRNIAANSASHRRISIVLEPLQHAEKKESQLPKEDARNKKAIEEVKVVQIQPEEKTVIKATEHPLYVYVKDLQYAFDKMGWSEKYKQIREPSSYARWIESQKLYRQTLTWLVERDLQSEGYSQEEIQKMINDIDAKEKNKQGNVR